MTDTPLIEVEADPDAPQLVELGEDGDTVVVMNTTSLDVAARIVEAWMRTAYADQLTAEETAAWIDELADASFTVGQWWWQERGEYLEDTLVNADLQAPPKAWPGVLVTFAESPL